MGRCGRWGEAAPSLSVGLAPRTASAPLSPWAQALSRRPQTHWTDAGQDGSRGHSPGGQWPLMCWHTRRPHVEAWKPLERQTEKNPHFSEERENGPDREPEATLLGLALPGFELRNSVQARSGHDPPSAFPWAQPVHWVVASSGALRCCLPTGRFGELCCGCLQLPGRQALPVAVHTLREGSSDSQRLSFLAEALTLGQFDHSHIVRLEGVVTRGSPLMIVTEYMSHGALDDFLRQHEGQLVAGQLMGLLPGLASAMKYLSEMGYVHRGLAARRVLVSPGLLCKISGFGRGPRDRAEAVYTTMVRAPSLPSPAVPTKLPGVPTSPYPSLLSGLPPNPTQLVPNPCQSGHRPEVGRVPSRGEAGSQGAGRMGVPHFLSALLSCPAQSGRSPALWAAPETLQFGHFSSASDVWSFGVVMWEVMAFGERPYWDMSGQDVIKAVEDGFRLPPPRNCPSALHRLMLDCWQKDPGERPRFSQIHSLLSRMGQDPEPPKGAAAPCARYLPFSPQPGGLDCVPGTAAPLAPLSHPGAPASAHPPPHVPQSLLVLDPAPVPSIVNAAWVNTCGRGPNTSVPNTLALTLGWNFSSHKEKRRHEYSLLQLWVTLQPVPGFSTLRLFPVPLCLPLAQLPNHPVTLRPHPSRECMAPTGAQSILAPFASLPFLGWPPL
uniref:Protein kinase domain-containing protein n=1 Tax=Oryctolagus cuniculus TaxID=9986 RepID=A0A5F9D1B6_RABIT